MKPWFKSRTLSWNASLIALLSAIMASDELSQWVDTLPANQIAIAGIVISVINIILRYLTAGRITR